MHGGRHLRRTPGLVDAQVADDVRLTDVAAPEPQRLLPAGVASVAKL